MRKSVDMTPCVRKVHNVNDEVVNCITVEEKKYEDVQGPVFLTLTEQKCDSWPVEKCTVEKVSVTNHELVLHMTTPRHNHYNDAAICSGSVDFGLSQDSRKQKHS